MAPRRLGAHREATIHRASPLTGSSGDPPPSAASTATATRPRLGWPRPTGRRRSRRQAGTDGVLPGRPVGPGHVPTARLQLPAGADVAGHRGHHRRRLRRHPRRVRLRPHIGGTSVPGALLLWPGSRSGLSAHPRIIRQDGPGIPGNDEDGDRFGAVVDLADLDGDRHADIVVGAPERSVQHLATCSGSSWKGMCPQPCRVMCRADGSARRARRSGGRAGSGRDRPRRSSLGSGAAPGGVEHVVVEGRKGGVDLLGAHEGGERHEGFRGRQSPMPPDDEQKRWGANRRMPGSASSAPASVERADHQLGRLARQPRVREVVQLAVQAKAGDHQVLALAVLLDAGSAVTRADA